jgi:hypothetical protein
MEGMWRADADDIQLLHLKHLTMIAKDMWHIKLSSPLARTLNDNICARNNFNIG